MSIKFIRLGKNRSTMLTSHDQAFLVNNHANRILTERSQIIYTGLAQNGEHPHILVIHQGTGQNIHKSRDETMDKTKIGKTSLKKRLHERPFTRPHLSLPTHTVPVCNVLITCSSNFNRFKCQLRQNKTNSGY